MKKELQVFAAEQKILNKIYAIRGQKVMLDEDLAAMYGVETRRLNEQMLIAFQRTLCLRLPKKSLII